jgi:hypothetical protein
MPYQATSKLTAKVSVCCEACGSDYTYEHVFKAYGRRSDEQSALALARQNRERVFEWQTKRVEAGNYSSMADYKPCPKCGYVQTWMVEPVRRRRGWQWGLALAGVTFLALIPVFLVIDVLSRGTPLSSLVPGLAVFMIFGMPVIVLFVTRAVVMKTFQANKNHAAPSPKPKTPTVSFHKSLDIKAPFTL